MQCNFTGSELRHCTVCAPKQTGSLHVHSTRTASRQNRTGVPAVLQTLFKHNSVLPLFMKCDLGDHSSACVLSHLARREFATFCWLSTRKGRVGERDDFLFNNMLMWSALVGKQDPKHAHSSQRGLFTQPNDLFVPWQLIDIWARKKCKRAVSLSNKSRKNVSTRNLKSGEKRNITMTTRGRANCTKQLLHRLCSIFE